MCYGEASAITKDIVKQLTDHREAQGLSYGQLAERTGLNRRSISLIEHGERTPTILTCLRLCQALDVSLADVIRRAEKSLK